ncbi:MAG: MATE family efflux transporter [Nitrospinota bacterium]|nr:MATE family efflux transporter [Nitrospinota bacterium]
MRGKSARLIEGDVGKTLMDLTLPMLYGVAGMVIFNLADTFFLGMLGTDELAAITFTFPVVLVIGSLAMGLGIGASAVISRAVGEGDHGKVTRLTTDSLILALCVVGIFVTAGFLTIEPMFRLLGADGEILELVKKYMVIWYAGIGFLIVPMVGNNAIRAMGDTKTPSLIMMVAAIVNVALDPLLIFGYGPIPRMEMEGAAIATIIARAITFVVAIYVLYWRESVLSFKLASLSDMLESWKQILHIGLPAAGSRMVVPVATGIITMLVATYGPEAVAAYGVASRIEFFGMIMVFALSVVLGPFIGQNLGAGKGERVREGVSYSKRFSIWWGAGIFLLMLAVAGPVASAFTDNPDVQSKVVLYLMVVPVGYGFFGIIQISMSVLNVLNRPYHASLLPISHAFIFYLPLAYAGSAWFGLPGIFYALTISYFLAGTLAHYLLEAALRSEISHS